MLDKSRVPSEIKITADNLKNFNKLSVGEKVEGNFAGEVIDIGEIESGEKGNPKQTISVSLTTIYIDKKEATSESKSKAMDIAYNKAEKKVKEGEDKGNSNA